MMNRRAWRGRAGHMFALARRHGEPLALLLLDIDHFKRINDQGGHEAGEPALHEQRGLGAGIVLDFSSGLALLREDDADLDQLIRRADEALYEAKAAGRDRLVVADGPVAWQPELPLSGG